VADCLPACCQQSEQDIHFVLGADHEPDAKDPRGGFRPKSESLTRPEPSIQIPSSRIAARSVSITGFAWPRIVNIIGPGLRIYRAIPS